MANRKDDTAEQERKFLAEMQAQRDAQQAREDAEAADRKQRLWQARLETGMDGVVVVRTSRFWHVLM